VKGTIKGLNTTGDFIILCSYVGLSSGLSSSEKVVSHPCAELCLDPLARFLRTEHVAIVNSYFYDQRVFQSPLFNTDCSETTIEVNRSRDFRVLVNFLRTNSAAVLPCAILRTS
jgi:hypothetical protein